MAGITITGFVPKTMAEIIEEMRARITSTFLPYAQFLPNQAITQLTDIFADGLSTAWEGQEALYNSSYLTASGVSLDMVAALQNKRRVEAQNAYMLQFKVVTSGATTITAGSRFGSTVPSAPIFQTNADIVISSAGTYRINVYAVDAGLIATDYNSVLKNTYTQNIDSVPSITSVVNDTTTSFVNGIDRETDASLRSRLQTASSNSNVYVLDAIRQAILALNTTLQASGYAQIEDCFIVANNTNVTDSDGRPPHSIEVVIYYSTTDSNTDSAIAIRIAAATQGCMETVTTTGISYSQNVVINSNTIYPVTFSRADTVNIYATIETSPALSSGQKTDLKNYLVTWGNALGLGQNVIVFGKNSLSQALNDFPNVDISDYTIKIGKTANPTLSDNIIINNTEVSRWDAARIVITDL